MNRRLRLGLVVASLAAGGAEKQMLALAERLPRERFDVDFLLLSRAGVNAERARRAGCGVRIVGPALRHDDRRLPFTHLRAAAKVANFARLVRINHYDILDAWLYHAYVLASLSRPVTRVPVLVSGRRSIGDLQDTLGKTGGFLKRISQKASDAIVANSQQVMSECIDNEGVGLSKLRLIRNGVEIPALAGALDRRELRRRLGARDDDFLVGHVANFRPGKGHDALLRAVHRAAAVTPTIRLLLIGEGPLMAQAQDLVSQLNLGDRVIMHGFEPNPPSILAALDAFAHPSEAEGSPNSVLEAAAAALPIVATPAGGTVEIVKHGQTGLLVPIGDEEALADALSQISREREVAAAMGRAARALVEREFGMDRYVDSFAQLYEELAERKGVGAGKAW